MKNSTENTEVLCLSTNPRQCVLRVSGSTLQQLEKFKYSTYGWQPIYQRRKVERGD